MTGAEEIRSALGRLLDVLAWPTESHRIEVGVEPLSFDPHGFFGYFAGVVVFGLHLAEARE
ncbi:hypothetical protein [Nocardia sp. NPDC005825]|uniref:hypothetical protein n=1 Tax=unclassified Nocardia TaxID=2637762 RepID=UPI0033F37A99